MSAECEGPEVSLVHGDNRELATRSSSLATRGLALAKSVTSIVARPITEIRRFDHGADRVHGVAFSPDGRWIVSGTDASVRLWECETGRQIRRFTSKLGRSRHVAFSSDGLQVVSASWTGVVRFDAQTAQEISLFKVGLPGVADDRTSLSSDGCLLLVGNQDGSISLWGTERGRELTRLNKALVPDHFKHMRVALSPDGRRCLGDSGGCLSLWDLSAGREIWQHLYYSGPGCQAFLPNNCQAVSGFDSAECITMFDLEDGRPTGWHSWPFDTWWTDVDEGFVSGGWGISPVRCMAVSPDGRSVLCGGEGWARPFHHFDPDTEANMDFRTPGALAMLPIAEFCESEDRCKRTSEQSKIASCSVGLWRMQRGSDESTVTTVAFSPDGRRAVTGSKDGTVRLWDLPE